MPKWRDGVITFKNVFVSRRPGQGSGQVSKGSSKTAAAVAATATKERPIDEVAHGDPTEEDTNYTQFDLSIDTVNVTLSFTKWFNGKGLLRDVEVKGIRGVIDRSHVRWKNDDADPKSYRHEHNPGDFELDSFKMEDLLVTVYQPNNFRPFSVSIFSCDLPQLRKQWLFYDFLSANMMSGSFDNSLFTIHPRQTHNLTGAKLNADGSEGGKSGSWKKQSRIRIDGLNIDHLNRGVEGPFSWIHEGTVDIVADIMFPAENDESLAKVVAEFYDRLEATVSNRHLPRESRELAGDERDSTSSLRKINDDSKRFLVTDLRIHLNNVRAVVPLFTPDLSYINNALIRPIVAYINSRRTFIPIHCRLVKPLSDFDGSWTIFDSGLMNDLSAAVSSLTPETHFSRFADPSSRPTMHSPAMSWMSRRANDGSRRSGFGRYSWRHRRFSWAWREISSKNRFSSLHVYEYEGVLSHRFFFLCPTGSVDDVRPCPGLGVGCAWYCIIGAWFFVMSHGRGVMGLKKERCYYRVLGNIILVNYIKTKELFSDQLGNRLPPRPFHNKPLYVKASI